MEKEKLKARVAELEEEKPDAAEIIELRKACGIYITNGKNNRKKILELNAELDMYDELVLFVIRELSAYLDDTVSRKAIYLRVIEERQRIKKLAQTRGKK